MDAVKKLKSFISFWYQRYLLAIELYMVEPWERVVFHIIIGIAFWLFWYFNSSVVLSGISRIRSTDVQAIDSGL